MNTSIVICGQKYDIGTRVVLWDEPGGLNGYDQSTNIIYEEDRKTGKKTKKVISGKRYKSRSFKKLNLSGLQNIITQFFMHHSGLYHSDTTFNVLHKERGLSVHFILDDDGTIYQTLDLVECAYHGGKNNNFSVGIEIDSRAMVNRFPEAYDEYNQKKHRVLPREKQMDQIHGNWMQGYTYNNKQYKALISLGICMSKMFPKMNNKFAFGKMIADFPRDSNGRIEKKVISNPQTHCGYIFHYHITENKVDPIAFDHWRFLMGVVNENCESKQLEMSDVGDEKANFLKRWNTERF